MNQYPALNLFSVSESFRFKCESAKSVAILAAAIPSTTVMNQITPDALVMLLKVEVPYYNNVLSRV